MDQFLNVLGLAMLSAAGCFAGGVLSELLRVSDRYLSLALHFSAGMILAVVGIELVDRVLEGGRPWAVCLAFVAGGAVAILLDKGMDSLRRRYGKSGRDGNGSGPWIVYASVAVDLFSDGIAIGTSATIASSLAFLVAIAQVTANTPEGFATIATFKKQRLTRPQRLLIAASFCLPAIAGATVGYWAVRDADQIYKLSLLAFTAGMLTTLVIEGMIAQAHAVQDSEKGGWQAMGLVGGFAAFMYISATLNE